MNYTEAPMASMQNMIMYLAPVPAAPKGVQGAADGVLYAECGNLSFLYQTWDQPCVQKTVRLW